MRQSYLTSSSLMAFSGIDYLTQLKFVLANDINTYVIRTLKTEVCIIYDIPTVHWGSLTE